MRRTSWRESAIKNHTATLVGRYVLVFGGYDGRGNHNDVHALDTVHNALEVPLQSERDEAPGRNGHTATLAPGCGASPAQCATQPLCSRCRCSRCRSAAAAAAPAAAAPAGGGADDSSDAAETAEAGHRMSRAEQAETRVEGQSSEVRATILRSGGAVAGHAHDRIFIVGGWLGRGPLAADDIHILHVRACGTEVGGSGDGMPAHVLGSPSSSSTAAAAPPPRAATVVGRRRSLRPGQTAPPGTGVGQPHVPACRRALYNMHTADYFESLRKVLVFRVRTT